MRAIIFNQQNMTAADLGHYAYVFSDKKTGVSKGLTMTTANGVINIASGRGIICGRMFAVDGNDSIAAPETTSGTLYCRLVCEVDLSKTSTSQACNQIYWKILQNAESYPTLTQQNLDDYPSTGVYQMPMAKFTVTTEGISNWVDERAQFDVILTGTLTAGNTSITISDPCITATSLLDIYTESQASGIPVNPSRIYTAVGSITLNFVAQAADLVVKVRVL